MSGKENTMRMTKFWRAHRAEVSDRPDSFNDSEMLVKLNLIFTITERRYF